MDITGLWPFINNAGASVLFIVFIWITHERTKLDHIRTLERDKANDETIRQLMIGLMDCTKTAVSGDQP